MGSTSRKHRWSDVTAVFGGSFDPPHRGHAEAIRGLFTRPGIQRVWVLPTGRTAYKKSSLSEADRRNLVRLAFTPEELHLGPGEIRVDERELDRASRFPDQPTYSFDTLLELGRELPELGFVIGTDQLRDLPRWHRFPHLLGLCHWIVLERKGQSEEQLRAALRPLLEAGLLRPQGDGTLLEYEISEGALELPRRGHPKRLTLVATPAPALSSSEIREAIARTGNPPENSLLPIVEAYLRKHQLYGMKATTLDR